MRECNVWLGFCFDNAVYCGLLCLGSFVSTSHCSNSRSVDELLYLTYHGNRQSFLIIVPVVMVITASLLWLLNAHWCLASTSSHCLPVSCKDSHSLNIQDGALNKVEQEQAAPPTAAGDHMIEEKLLVF